VLELRSDPLDQADPLAQPNPTQADLLDQSSRLAPADPLARATPAALVVPVGPDAAVSACRTGREITTPRSPVDIRIPTRVNSGLKPVSYRSQESEGARRR
jgi:hypothetical protein